MLRKKFTGLIYLLVMAMFILPLTGCGSDDDDESSSGGTTTASQLLVVSSKAFVNGDNYRLYTANNPKLAGTTRETPRYYVAPDASDTETTLQLEFDGSLSNDKGFIITDADGYQVFFAYNPNGTEDEVGTSGVTMATDTSTGGNTRMSYTSLDLSGSLTGSSIKSAYIDVTDEDVIKIVLDSSDKSVTVNGTDLTNYNLVWHVSPDHAGEYWVYDGTEYDDEEDAITDIGVEKVEGVYVAYDVRYVPDYLTFSSKDTVAKSKEAGDSDEMYVSYYTVSGYENYILAALPTEMGAAMGGTPGETTGGPEGTTGTPGGTPPSGTPGSSVKPAAVTDFDSIVDAMTHSVSEAKKNPVVHITKAGTYSLEGTWDGQIWIDIPDESTTSGTDTEDDPNAQVILILNGVKVNCTVAPALVFKNVFECGPSELTSSVTSFDVGENLFDDTDAKAGAVVVIGDASTNTFTGTNVARLNKLVDTDDYKESEVGDYVKAQKKMYKLDAAFHSRQSMVIALAYGASSGTLNVVSDYEGLDSEMHMLINSGTINVTADDDGINVNEDDVSVFTMDGGTLAIESSGGDGIDSNGYVVINGGTLTISAGSSKQDSAGEAGIDAEKGVYIYDDSAYTWYEAGTSVISDKSDTGDTAGGDGDGDTSKPTYTPSTSDTITDEEGNKVATVTFNATPEEVKEATYTAEERINTYGVEPSGNTFKVLTGVNNFSGIN